MLVVVSGYNASGKTTLVRSLAETLRKNSAEYRLIRFDNLFPSALVTKKKKKRVSVGQDGSLGLREIEGQRGSWNRRLTLGHFLNTLGAIMAVSFLRLTAPRKVTLFDRYFYDRLIHFDPSGLWFRILRRIIPKPAISFVLVPADSEWEKRLLARLKRRFDIDLIELPEKDREELSFVKQKYEDLCRDEPNAVRVDSSNLKGTEGAWDLLQTHLLRLKATS